MVDSVPTADGPTTTAESRACDLITTVEHEFDLRGLRWVHPYDHFDVGYQLPLATPRVVRDPIHFNCIIAEGGTSHRSPPNLRKL